MSLQPHLQRCKCLKLLVVSEYCRDTDKRVDDHGGIFEHHLVLLNLPSRSW
jgi:hypothetical protein